MQTKLGLKIWTIKYKPDSVGLRRRAGEPRMRCEHLRNKNGGNRKEETIQF